MADGPWETVRAINAAWRTGDVLGLRDRFHEDAVMVPPGFEGRSEGREACVRSYQEFTDNATVRRLDELDPQVDVVGDTAVVTYRFEISYEMGGETQHDAGRDVFVLVRSAAGAWQAVWRTVVMES